MGFLDVVETVVEKTVDGVSLAVDIGKFAAPFVGGAVEMMAKSEATDKDKNKDMQLKLRQESMLKKFPVGSECQLELSATDSAFPNWHRPEPSDWYRIMAGHAHIQDGLMRGIARMINRESGFYEDVHVELELPKVEIPSLDIPPYRANQIAAVCKLAARLAPGLTCGYVPFANAVAETFAGKTLSFEVIGGCIGYDGYDCLYVSCREINEAIEQRRKEFISELDEIKATFADSKKADESRLKIGSSVAGRIVKLNGFANMGFVSGGIVELDGITVYSATLKLAGSGLIGKRRMTFSPLPDAINEVREFVVEGIDETSLTVTVSSIEFERAMAQMTEAGIGSTTFRPSVCSAAKFNGNPMLIDGNNVVRHNKDYGWRVLKTLLAWLNNNGIAHRLYFDASIEYVEMDAVGKKFVKTLLEDSNTIGSNVVKCPAGDEADKFMLSSANNSNGHILSNDTFRDRENEYPWVNARQSGQRRVHRFLVEDGYLSIPDFGTYEKIVSE